VRKASESVFNKWWETLARGERKEKQSVKKMTKMMAKVEECRSKGGGSIMLVVLEKERCIVGEGRPTELGRVQRKTVAGANRMIEGKSVGSRNGHSEKGAIGGEEQGQKGGGRKIAKTRRR